jgi:hypothetical protein
MPTGKLFLWELWVRKGRALIQKKVKTYYNNYINYYYYIIIGVEILSIIEEWCLLDVTPCGSCKNQRFGGT